MESRENFSLRWNDFESNISSSFQDLRNNSEFFDVTLCCNNGIDTIQAHRVILAASSPFFLNILSHQRNHQNPLIYLKGVSLNDLEMILEFIYHGKVNIVQESLNNFLKVANELNIKGLSEGTQSPIKTEKKI